MKGIVKESARRFGSLLLVVVLLFSLLPDRAYLSLMRYERYGFLVLYALIFFGALDGFLGKAVYTVYSALFNLFF